MSRPHGLDCGTLHSGQHGTAQQQYPVTQDLLPLAQFLSEKNSTQYLMEVTQNAWLSGEREGWMICVALLSFLA